ncbi:hypothetical protein HT105_24835, partial [Bacteroides fragilis]|nr:hypothetical protein [Bacteroides fragilis]
YIGYHLQQAIENVLRMRNLERDCYSLITQTVVDENDPAFDNPTKPIGVYYSEEYIGYHLQQAIENVLRMRNLERDCYSLITQTVVD